MDCFEVPAFQQRFELEIKRSRFISTFNYVDNRSAGKDFIDSVRKTYPDANHHCWAMIAGAPDDLFGQDQSDDGEPKGTAGKPMLNVLQHSGLGHVVVVVTRYFGGIKLGAGGLVRAYSQSVSAALHDLDTTQKYIQFKWSLKVPYTLYNSLEHQLAATTIQIGDKRFEDVVHVELLVPRSEDSALKTLLGDLGQGDIEFSCPS